MRPERTVHFEDGFRVVWPAFIITIVAFGISLGVRLLCAVNGPIELLDKHSRGCGVAVAVGAVVAAAVMAWLWGVAIALMFAIVAAAATPWLLDVHHAASSARWWILAGIVVLYLIAREFARWTLRSAAILLVIMTLLLALHVGQRRSEDDGASVARETATGLMTTIGPMNGSIAQAAKDAAARDAAASPATTRKAFSAAIDAAQSSTSPNLAVIADAQALEAGLRTGVDDASAQDLLDQLNSTAVAADLTTASQAMVSAADVAVKARDAAPTAETSHQANLALLNSANQAIAKLCTGSSGVQETDSAACVEHRGGKLVSRRDRAVRVAEAESKTADLTAVVTPSKDNTAAQTAKKAALATAKTQRDLPPPSTEIRAALAAGGDELISSLPLLGDRDLPIAMALAGWIVAALIALVTYRWFEVRNSSGALGPITSVELGPKGKDLDPLEPVLRVAVLNNIPEPGSLPGTESSKPMTDLAELAELAGPTAGPIVKALLTVVHAVASPVTGYRVSVVCDVVTEATKKSEEDAGTPPAVIPAAAAAAAAAAGVSPSATPDPSAEVSAFVRIQDARSKETLASKLLPPQEARKAVNAAGFWAAGWILGCAAVVPRWTRWDTQTADALALYTDAGAAKGDALEKALAASHKAPTSGVVLVQLGDELDSAKQHREAFACHLRAATMYPRYITARFRVSQSASLLCSDLSEHWFSASREERQYLAESMVRFLKRSDCRDLIDRVSRLADCVDEHDVATILCKVALLNFERLEKMLNWRWAAHNSLRRDERRYWIGLAGVRGPSRAHRSRFGWIVRSSIPSIVVRGHLDETETKLSTRLEKVNKECDKPKSWWQVAYNLACYHAVRSTVARDGIDPRQQRRLAVARLALALERTGAEQMASSWIDVDPDLAEVRNEPGFKRVLERLRS